MESTTPEGELPRPTTGKTVDWQRYYASRRHTVDGIEKSIDCPDHLHGRAGGATYYRCPCPTCRAFLAKKARENYWRQKRNRANAVAQKGRRDLAARYPELSGHATPEESTVGSRIGREPGPPAPPPATPEAAETGSTRPTVGPPGSREFRIEVRKRLAQYREQK